MKKISQSTDKSYSFPNGEKFLQQQLYKQLSDQYYIPSLILIGNGLKELIFTLIGSFKGKIILPLPSWVSYQQMIEAWHLQNQVVYIKTYPQDNYLVQPTRLKKIIQEINISEKILFIFNNPHNPTGILCNESYLKDLSETINNLGVSG